MSNRTIKAQLGQSLSLQEIQSKVPSVFSESPSSAVSQKYTFIPTSQLVSVFSELGFQKHCIKFRHVNLLGKNAGDVMPEIIAFNSHNGTSSFRLMAGIYRLVCANGLVVGQALLDSIKLRHVGYSDEKAAQAIQKIASEFPAVIEAIEKMKVKTLTDSESYELAKSAIALRWEEQAPITPDQALVTHRQDDRQQNLWNVFNVVQENVIRGGMIGRDTNNRQRLVRQVTNITQDSKINSGLWDIAMKFAA
jgi:hypothetical protein